MKQMQSRQWLYLYIPLADPDSRFSGDFGGWFDLQSIPQFLGDNPFIDSSHLEQTYECGPGSVQGHDILEQYPENHEVERSAGTYMYACNIHICPTPLLSVSIKKIRACSWKEKQGR